MAVVIPTGYAQVVLHWENNTGDSNWATVLGSEHTALAANDIFETYLNAYRSWVQPFQDTNLECTYITVKMGPSTGPTPGLSVDFPVGEVGENAMSGAPSNCTMLVRKLSIFGGRANRGRNFWPGLVADGQVDELGRIDPAVVSSMQSNFVSFFGALSSGNGGTTALCPGVILHDSESPAAEPAVISAVQVDSVIGTQRRRIRR